MISSFAIVFVSKQGYGSKSSEVREFKCKMALIGRAVRAEACAPVDCISRLTFFAYLSLVSKRSLSRTRGYHQSGYRRLSQAENRHVDGSRRGICQGSTGWVRDGA